MQKKLSEIQYTAQLFVRWPRQFILQEISGTMDWHLNITRTLLLRSDDIRILWCIDCLTTILQRKKSTEINCMNMRKLRGFHPNKKSAPRMLKELLSNINRFNTCPNAKEKNFRELSAERPSGVSM